MRRYFKSMFGTRAAHGHTVRRAVAGIRLGMTALEDRLTPADLLVSSVGSQFVPVTSPGQPLAVQFTVTNVGLPTNGNFSDRVRLSNDAIVSADDVSLGTAQHTGGLGVGTVSASVSGVVPANARTGIRNLIVTTDANNQIPETSEANNSRATPIIVLPSAVAGSTQNLVGRLQSAIGGSLIPTAMNTVGTSTAISFGISSSAGYRIGGFRVTNLQATVTITAAGNVSAVGTANLEVPTGGGNTVIVPITFSATPTILTVNGSRTLTSFQFGTNPQVTATNATLTANLAVQLATGAVNGSARVTANNVTLRSSGQAVLAASNFQATITAAGQLSATAATVSVLGGRANASTVSFSFAMDSGRITGSVAQVTGAIGPVTMSATAANLVIAPGSADPLLSIASASVSVPVNGGAANLTATGFRISQAGRFQFDALAGLPLPGQTPGGAQITGTFSGEVRLNGTTVVVSLNGNATAFNTPVQVRGDLTASPSGMFGALTLQTAGNGTVTGLGQNLGFAFTGTARFFVNSTNAARTITAGNVTRTIATTSGRLVADGNLSARGFTLAGQLEVVPGVNNTAQVTLTGSLNLGRFGLLQTVGTGSFRIANGGLVGSIGTNQVNIPVGGFALPGPKSFELNTSPGRIDGIDPGAALRASNGITVGGFSIGGAVRVGFRDNPGTANDFHFATVGGNVSLFDGFATVRMTGEVRSNGFVSLTGSKSLTIGENLTAGTGISLNGTLAVSLTRTSGDGTVTAGISYTGGIFLFGVPLGEAVATFDTAGHVHVSQVVAGVTLLSVEFDL